MTDLAERIDRLEARLEIADLIHTYARHIRRDEPEKVHELFLPDGTFEVRDGHPDRPDFTVRSHYASAQEVHDHLAPNKGKPHPVPLIRNLIVEVDGDSATANSVMDATIYGTAHAIQGEYRDVCRRVDGRWYFKSRIYTIYAGASSI
ncbi:MAG: nuclear transport factor 2 family protein [Sphingomonadales bacterium]|nr:nuclear transport factor 2 family protein [Sphingomonadales bacterium]